MGFKSTPFGRFSREKAATFDSLINAAVTKPHVIDFVRRLDGAWEAAGPDTCRALVEEMKRMSKVDRIAVRGVFDPTTHGPRTQWFHTHFDPLVLAAFSVDDINTVPDFDAILDEASRTTGENPPSR